MERKTGFLVLSMDAMADANKFACETHDCRVIFEYVADDAPVFNFVWMDDGQKCILRELQKFIDGKWTTV